MAETYNPIIGKETVSPLISLRCPRPEPGVALVLFREGHPLATLWPGDRLAIGEVRWRKHRVIYKIDVSEHSFSFERDLPCKSDAFDFHAEVQVTCSVDDPARIVSCNISDARVALRPLIFSTMRNVSHDYDVEQSAEAERAIIEAVEREKYNIGFRIDRFALKLSLEEEARAYIRELKRIERDKEREEREGELKTQRDKLEIERMKMKMDFYSPLIKEGLWELFALQLTKHPEDVATVAQLFRQDRDAAMERQLRALKIMLEHDVLEIFHVEEAGKRVLQRFIETWGLELEAKALEGAEEPKTLTEKKEEEIGTESETGKADSDGSTGKNEDRS